MRVFLLSYLVASLPGMIRNGREVVGEMGVGIRLKQSCEDAKNHVIARRQFVSLKGQDDMLNTLHRFQHVLVDIKSGERGCYRLQTEDHDSTC